MNLFASHEKRYEKADSTLGIAINALSARIGGGVTYLNRLIYYLRKVDNRNSYYIFVTSNNRRKIISFKDPRFHVIEVRAKFLLQRLLYEQFALPIVLKQLGIDILYAPADTMPLLAPCPTVLGIQNPNIYYDVYIKRTLAEKCKYWALRQHAKLSSRIATRIIFVSETAREYIAAKLKVDQAKTRAIHHGVELNKFRQVDQANNPARDNHEFDFGEYILCLSSLARHKNIEMLIAAYSKLDEGLKRQYKLVIAGRKVSPYCDELLALSQQLGVNEQVVFTGEVPFEKVPVLYRQAILFVLPSILETFGIPLIEAMASSVPVIAADATAIPEVVGNAGFLFDLANPDELRAQMEAVLNDPNLRERLVQSGLERASLFTWEKCAEETLAVLVSVQSNVKDPDQ